MSDIKPSHLMSDKIVNPTEHNPWKGLNFYNEGEVLYGRDKEIQSLSRYIIDNIQTVLYGKSGIGKSSIVNAGIFPIARREGLYPVPLRLTHDGDTFLPYINQIKQAFTDSGIGLKEILPPISDSQESLWEFFHRHHFCHPDTQQPVRPLVVLDQFEEIFTLQSNEKLKRAFFSELADLINEVTPQYIIDAQREKRQSNTGTQSPFNEKGEFVLDFGVNNDSEDYVTESLFNLVFIIREDYLSYFERYTAYIPALKSNRCSLLPINEQAADIITKPQPGLINLEVAHYIIQKVTRKTDFKLDGIPEIEVDAAVLSLYLSRLFIKKGNRDTITKELVDQFSDDIIKDFYEEAVSDISIDEIEKIEDQLLTYEGRRNNVSRNDLITDGVSNRTLDLLVDVRKLLRQFSYQDDTRIEFMHDILCPIVDERIKQRELAKLIELENQKLEKEQKKFIEEERLKREKILMRARAEKERHREETLMIKKRNRMRIKWLAAAILALLTILAGYYINRQLTSVPYSCNYASFTTINGWPVGINEINPNDKHVKDSLLVYYRLTRAGRLRPGWWRGNNFTKVEVISTRDNNPTTNKFIASPVVGLWESELETDKRAADFAKLQLATSYWVYTANDREKGVAGKCTAFNNEGRELYSVQFNRDNTYSSGENEKYVQWAVYYDATGKQMMLNNKGVDRMRQTVNKGIITSNLFFTMLGVPQSNIYNTYGYQYEFDDKTHMLKEQYCLDKFGTKIDSTHVLYTYDGLGRMVKSSICEVEYPQRGTFIYKYKSYNDTLSFNESGHLAAGSLHFVGEHTLQQVFKYNQKQLPILRQQYTDGKLDYSRLYAYQAGENRPHEIHIREKNLSYTERHEYLPDSTEITSFWTGGKKASVIKMNEQGDTLYYHCSKRSHRTEKNYRIQTTEYVDSTGQLITKYPSNNNYNIYSKYELFKDSKTKNTLLEYYYNREGEIVKSQYFEYDQYGNRIAQGVAGIDRTPVRCMDWSWDNLCCYKMAILMPFYNTQGARSSLNGINEFGENSLIMGHDNQGEFIMSITEVPMKFFTKKEDKGNIVTGLSLSNTDRSRCDMRLSAIYVHTLSKKGTFYSSGLRDGDILISINGTKVFPASSAALQKAYNLKDSGAGGNITALQLDDKSNTYKLNHISIPKGKTYCHPHQVQLTPQEYDRLTKSL